MSTTELPTQDQLIAELVNEIIVTGDDFSIQYKAESKVILEQMLLDSKHAYYVTGKYSTDKTFLIPTGSKQLTDEDHILSKEITEIVKNLVTSITSVNQIELCT